MADHIFELVLLEEAPTDVVLLQKRDVWLVEQLARLNGQAEHPLQDCEFTVDLPVRDLTQPRRISAAQWFQLDRRCLTVSDILANIGGCH
ncbi:MAG: hypothetical protein QF634_16485 [Vicinamibacterales bacterium]|nr:hypothetical protein [Vicinamibacterales bacterium]